MPWVYSDGISVPYAQTSFLRLEITFIKVYSGIFLRHVQAHKFVIQIPLGVSELQASDISSWRWDLSGGNGLFGRIWDY